jgi:hypothetical protein
MSISERETFLPLDKLLVGTSCIGSSFADDMHTPGGLRNLIPPAQQTLTIFMVSAADKVIEFDPMPMCALALPLPETHTSPSQHKFAHSCAMQAAAFDGMFLLNVYAHTSRFCSSSRNGSRLSPAELFAQATPKCPLDRGHFVSIQSTSGTGLEQPFG